MKNTNKIISLIALVALLTACSGDTTPPTTIQEVEQASEQTDISSSEEVQTPESQYLDPLESSDDGGGGEA